MAIQILVVDDDADLRDLLRIYLSNSGFEVSVLHGASSLERRLEWERPDLIVLDPMMPDSVFALLKIFVDPPMHALNRERLLELLHGPEYDGTDRGIDVQLWRPRRIVETDPSAPSFIQTVRGRGHMFVPDGATLLGSP